MSLKRISDVLDEKQRKMTFSNQNLMLNKADSLLFCDVCTGRLGFWRVLYHALFKKQGEPYYIVCKECKSVNKRIKGDYAKKIDSDWDKYGV